MFYLGLVVLLIGAIAVYLNKFIEKRTSLTAQQALWVKAVGLLMVILGAILIILSEFPQELEFLRFINLGGKTYE
ncbi:hypothetical protein [Alkaliphilus crotonatoxidans]